MLGLNSFSLEKVVEVDPTIMDEEEEADAGHVHDEHCGHLHVHDEHCKHEHVHDDHCKHDHDHGHAHGHDHKAPAAADDGHSHGHAHGHDHKTPAADAGHDHGHAHGHEKKKKKTHNLSLVSSVGFTIEGELDVPKFNGFMGDLLKVRVDPPGHREKGRRQFESYADI